MNLLSFTLLWIIIGSIVTIIGLYLYGGNVLLHELLKLTLIGALLGPLMIVFTLYYYVTEVLDSPTYYNKLMNTIVFKDKSCKKLSK